MGFSKKIFSKAFHWYVDTVKEYLTEEDKDKVYSLRRPEQIRVVTDCLFEHFGDFENINCIETGASYDVVGDGGVGLYFSKLCELTNGEFHSVELDNNLINDSNALYKKHNLESNHILGDSVEYLKNTDFIPNLVHLDSWNVDLKNPLPSALHGWREFTAIESKMPVGSILIIDDNWFNGTWVEWWTRNEENELQSEIVNIDYPVLGKGALVWHHINGEQGNKSNWEIIYPVTSLSGGAKKLILKKIK